MHESPCGTNANRIPAIEQAATLPVGKAQFSLSMHEIGLTSLAGGIWTLYNVGYIIFVSFAPSLLTAQGMSAEHAGFAVSFATWTIIVTIPIGGMLVDRIGHATAVMIMSLTAFGLVVSTHSCMRALRHAFRFGVCRMFFSTKALDATPRQ